MKPKHKVAFLFVLISCSATAQTKWKENFSYRGYVKDLRLISIDAKGHTLQQNFIHNRFNFRYQLKSNLKFGLELRNRFFYGEFLKYVPNYGDQLEYDPGVIDMTWSWINNREFVAHTTIDRMWLNWSNDKWDIRIGRQRINWGQNIVWNPNDLFNVLNFANFDYEERPPADALKIEHYLKKGGSLNFGYKFAKKWEETVFVTMYRFNKKLYDVQILAGKYHRDAAVGLGWAGSIKNAGFKGEATYFEPIMDSSDRAFITSVSVDFLMKKGPYVVISTLYNTLGTSDLNKLLQLTPTAGGTLDVKHLMPNKYSLFVQAGGSVTPLLSLNLAVIGAIDIKGVFMMPTIAYNLKTNLDLNIIGQSFLGDSDKWRFLSNGIFVRLKQSF
ncbi:MAG: hypothetical protein GC181_09070 [Bacteroidetes bacterium]|nr:hypothetical protein [Bacteroidota bacterium]